MPEPQQGSNILIFNKSFIEIKDEVSIHKDTIPSTMYLGVGTAPFVLV